MISNRERPVKTEDARRRRLHSPRPFRDPRVAPVSHRGWALSLSTVLVILGLSLVPADWIRWVMGVQDPARMKDLEVDEPREPQFIQLLPSGGSPAPEPPAFDEIQVEAPKPDVEVAQKEEEPATADDHDEWTFDPTRVHGLASTMEDFEAGVAPPDSMQLARSMLYREMSPGRWPAGALVDYSDRAIAREKWEQSDEWFRRVWGRRWIAQGDSARKRDIYDRTVTDVERKGVQ